MLSPSTVDYKTDEEDSERPTEYVPMTPKAGIISNPEYFGSDAVSATRKNDGRDTKNATAVEKEPLRSRDSRPKKAAPDRDYYNDFNRAKPPPTAAPRMKPSGVYVRPITESEV